jgi:MFS family permease
MAEISSDANNIERSLALTRTTDLPQLDTDELPPREMNRTSELDTARETVDLQTEDVTAESSSSLQIGLSYRVGFTLASMVAGLSSVCIKQLLLPLQVSFIAPHSTNTSFALVSAIGALAGLFAAPVTGALADRTTLRWGRRRPWITFGIFIGVVGLLIMAWSTTIPLLIFGEILEQIGVDAILSNVTALIPDQVPEQKRANTAALNGIAPVIGGVVGLILVTVFTNTQIVSQGYVVLAIVSILCVGFFLLVLREQPLQRSLLTPFHLRTFFASFVHPLQSPDFVFTLLSRLLVFLCYTLLGSYLFFYLRSIFHLPVALAARGVTTYQLISTAVLIVIALLTGYFSQRFDRLKPFVFVGAVLMALGVFIIVVFPTWSALFIAAALFGGGFGLYLGVDIALAVRVLPSDLSRGKDLGIIYTAIFFPLIVTPIIGAFILNSFANNFELLFMVAAISSLLAAVLILPIKSVR